MNEVTYPRDHQHSSKIYILLENLQFRFLDFCLQMTIVKLLQ